MKQARIRLRGCAPYSQSRPHRDAKLERETHDAYELRTWRSRLHVNSQGELFLPAQAIKNCLAEAAKFAGKQIPGKGKSTYTKHFESGILIPSSPVIYGKGDRALLLSDCDVEGSQVFGDWIFTPSDGVAGSGKRVYRCYPVIKDPWSVEFDLVVADEIITQPVLAEHLKTAGMLIGLGRWRVRNRGSYGQFVPEILSWGDSNV